MTNNDSLPTNKTVSCATPKRSYDATSPNQPDSRQKRNKYTPVACNECKKRKIKCGGEATCQNCQHFGTQCIYDRKDMSDLNQATLGKIAAMDQEMIALKAQVNRLSADMLILQQQQNPSQLSQMSVSPSKAKQSHGHIESQRSSEPTRPKFVGPTSAAFGFGVANSTLQRIGVPIAELVNSPTLNSAVASRQGSPDEVPNAAENHVDPLCAMNLTDIYRLINVYKEEINPIYPFMPIHDIIQKAPHTYENYLAFSSLSSSSSRRMSDDNEKEVRILKTIMASALVVEGQGESRIGQKLAESAENSHGRSVREVEVDIKELQILTLMSIYYFHCDDEVLAWRTIGFAARVAIELGLHRKDSLYQNFPDKESREWALRLFWCIYVLDRRWSLGTGMPFALHDSDMDPELPMVEASTPYLGCLVAYGKICSKVWGAVAGFGKATKGLDKDGIGYLDFQIQQWQESIPAELRLVHPTPIVASQNQPDTLHMIRSLLYVRGNHLRILIHRRSVLSAKQICDDLEGARLVTSIAKDTISIIVHLKETSNVYQGRPNVFNYFLVSALAALFLAVCHAPAEFSRSCRDEFYSALDLVKGFSSKSFHSKRLWKTVRGLKLVAPKLGLVSREQEAILNNAKFPSQQNNNAPSTIPSFLKSSVPDPQQNFSPLQEIAMLPTHHESESTPAQNSIVPDLYQISNDLTNFYEAFGRFEGGVGAIETDREASQFLYDPTFSLENGDEFSRIFEDLL
ncbi:fungal-specific transcription factor domain-containing protein [Bisporella sp. PMI_857]|nr:fungal-specific transcription factor domain-containing protein [Bisporella sp. PMI_857]